MEAIPETVRAIRDFGPFVVEDEDLLAELAEKAARLVEIVPQCVGVSLASIRDGLTFTMVATDAEIAVLDGVQYLSGGPCADAVETEADHQVQYEPALGEERWLLFAQATAATNVASTLTLPIIVDDDVVGSVNLYASAPGVFTDHHEQVAEIFGAWAAGAVTNADLSFSTRSTAEQAPRLMREDIDVHVAIALIATRDGTDATTARARLVDAARRAGVSEGLMAMTLIRLEQALGSD